jgi:hydroxymethylbilane synthase
LANYRPDLTFAGLRGNLATRLAIAGTGTVVAVVAAKAALDRLEWSPPDGIDIEVLSPTVMLPQVGQGALAVECRDGDDTTRAALAALDDPGVSPLVIAERSFLAALGGGCTLPVGANASWVTGPRAPDGSPAAMTVTGLLASPDGVVVLRHTGTGIDPVEVGRSVAGYLLDEAGGRALGDWIPVGVPVETT